MCSYLGLLPIDQFDSNTTDSSENIWDLRYLNVKAQMKEPHQLILIASKW